MTLLRSGRAVVEVTRAGRRVRVICYGRALVGDPAIVRAEGLITTEATTAKDYGAHAYLERSSRCRRPPARPDESGGPSHGMAGRRPAGVLQLKPDLSSCLADMTGSYSPVFTSLTVAAHPGSRW